MMLFRPLVIPLDRTPTAVHPVFALLELKEPNHEVLEQLPHPCSVPAKVREPRIAGRLVDEQALVHQPAQREQKTDSGGRFPIQLHLCEQPPTEPHDAHALERAIRQPDPVPHVSIQIRDSQQHPERRTEDAVARDIVRQFLEVARHAATRPQRARRRVTQSDFAPDAGQILAHLAIAAIEAPAEISRRVPVASR